MSVEYFCQYLSIGFPAMATLQSGQELRRKRFPLHRLDGRAALNRRKICARVAVARLSHARAARVRSRPSIHALNQSGANRRVPSRAPSHRAYRLRGRIAGLQPSAQALASTRGPRAGNRVHRADSVYTRAARGLRQARSDVPPPVVSRCARVGATTRRAAARHGVPSRSTRPRRARNLST